MQIEVGTAGYSSKIVMQSMLRMDFASSECLTYGLSGMCISPGYFQFCCSDRLHLYCKVLKGQAHAMIACSSLPFSVFV